MMTKDEVRKYIELHGDARLVIDTIKEMKAEGIDVTENALDERLSDSSTPDELEDYMESSSSYHRSRPNPAKVILTAVVVGAVVAVVGFIVLTTLL